MYVPDPAGYVECRFKAGATTDAPGNKECVTVVGNIDTDNPNHFSTQEACKNDCGNSYNCIDCDCGISKGLNGSEIIATCDASCPDKTYRCDNGRCIQDVCPSAGNPGLTYAACRLQCGKYRCPGSTTTTFGVIAWGVNTYDQSIVPASATNGVSAISAGFYHNVALKNNGEVLAWGNNSYGQCDVPDGAKRLITHIGAGSYHSVARNNQGQVMAWGAGTTDQGSSGGSRGIDFGQSIIPNHAAVINSTSAISAGHAHTIILKNGQVYGWGRNSEGQCLGTDDSGNPIGIDGNSDGTIPVQINGSTLTGVSAIAGGYLSSVALKNGGVIAWGRNNNDFVPINAQSGVTAVACGFYHTIVIKDGQVFAWGMNNFGQCLGTDINGNQIATMLDADGTVPVKINGITLTGVTAIAGGDRHTIALKDGKVLAWGRNLGGLEPPLAAERGVTAIASWFKDSLAIGGTVTTATECDFYGDTDTGFDTNALCEANTTCNTGVKYHCVYTTCPNGRVLGSTCQPTTTFVAGVTYYDSFGECEASACADVVDQGNRWKCVNNDCVFINYCDGDGTYKEESGPNGCHDNCWGWNCKNNQCTSERFATNNHDNCAESCHCKWSAINITGQGTACPACIKICGRELANARSNNVPCTDEWATTCPVAYGYYDTEAACKQFLIDNDFGEFICKENGTCERLNPAFPLETECGKYCSKPACEASCRRASPGYECVEPPVPYSGRTTCRQITSCSGGTAPYETLEDCISGCDYIVSRGWNCRTSDSGISTCVALTSITDGIPQFTSSALCNRFCINNFGWNCKSNVCIKAWEAPGSFSSYAQCLSVCNAPDPNQGPCGNVIDSTTGSVNNGGSAA